MLVATEIAFAASTACVQCCPRVDRVRRWNSPSALHPGYAFKQSCKASEPRIFHGVGTGFRLAHQFRRQFDLR